MKCNMFSCLNEPTVYYMWVSWRNRGIFEFTIHCEVHKNILQFAEYGKKNCEYFEEITVEQYLKYSIIK